MKKRRLKKRKYYLIDTENVGDRWMEYIPRPEDESILVVFYTKNHSRLLEECYLKQRYNSKVRWVECVEGDNALDQQLTGVLAYLIASRPGAKYIILSNDKGFNKIADFWSKREVHVERTGTGPIMGKEKSEKSGDLGRSDWFEILTYRIGESSDSGGIQEIYGKAQVRAMILEVARAIPVKNLSGWHAALTCLFGAETGRQYYMRLKGDKECAQVFSEYLIPDEEKRNVYLIALIFWHGHLDVRAAEETYKAIAAHRKNRKAIKGEVSRRLAGKTEEPAQYYRAVKPLVSCLLWRE